MTELEALTGILFVCTAAAAGIWFIAGVVVVRLFQVSKNQKHLLGLLLPLVLCGSVFADGATPPGGGRYVLDPYQLALSWPGFTAEHSVVFRVKESASTYSNFYLGSAFRIATAGSAAIYVYALQGGSYVLSSTDANGAGGVIGPQSSHNPSVMTVDGLYHHYVLTFKAASGGQWDVWIYKDGAPVFGYRFSSASSTSASPSMLFDRDASRVAELRIYNGAMTAGEVAALYSSDTPPGSCSAVGLFACDEGAAVGANGLYNYAACPRSVVNYMISSAAWYSETTAPAVAAFTGGGSASVVASDCSGFAGASASLPVSMSAGAYYCASRFTGTLSASVTGLPGGVTLSGTLPAVGSSGSLLLSVGSGVAAGTYSGTLVITNSAGGSFSDAFTLTVSPVTFALSVSPSSVSMGAGTSETLTVAATATGGSPSGGSVSLDVSGLPAGSSVVGDFVTVGGTSDIVVSVPAGAVWGVYDLIVEGTLGGVTESDSVSVTVEAASLEELPGDRFAGDESAIVWSVAPSSVPLGSSVRLSVWHYNSEGLSFDYYYTWESATAHGSAGVGRTKNDETVSAVMWKPAAVGSYVVTLEIPGLEYSEEKTVFVYGAPVVAYNPESDLDQDGTPNSSDTDDDGDGVPDSSDRFPLDPDENSDFDNDGIGDGTDSDDDNDGHLDGADAFPFNAGEWQDTDNDGFGNNADFDDDGDGVPDYSDNTLLAVPVSPEGWSWSVVKTVDPQADCLCYADICLTGQPASAISVQITLDGVPVATMTEYGCRRFTLECGQPHSVKLTGYIEFVGGGLVTINTNTQQIDFTGDPCVADPPGGGGDGGGLPDCAFFRQTHDACQQQELPAYVVGVFGNYHDILENGSQGCGLDWYERACPHWIPKEGEPGSGWGPQCDFDGDGLVYVVDPYEVFDVYRTVQPVEWPEGGMPACVAAMDYDRDGVENGADPFPCLAANGARAMTEEEAGFCRAQMALHAWSQFASVAGGRGLCCDDSDPVCFDFELERQAWIDAFSEMFPSLDDLDYDGTSSRWVLTADWPVVGQFSWDFSPAAITQFGDWPLLIVTWVKTLITTFWGWTFLRWVMQDLKGL